MVQTTPVFPEDGMTITEDTVFAPGLYVFRKGLTVAADGITIDGAGATFVGSTDWPCGLRIEGRKNVTIKNLCTLGYYHGIVIKDSSDISIVGSHMKAASELDPYSHGLSVLAYPDGVHGAGIFIENTDGAVISDNDVSHQQNGILAYGCKNLLIERNNTSMCTGQGVYLYASCGCTIQDNMMDFCARIYHLRDGRIDIGAGTASVMMINGSSRNIIRRNYMRGSGDGVLACGYPDMDYIAPCVDNVIEENDASYCLNVSYEATFCSRNLFRENKANASNYGFWLGYSSDMELIDNEVNENRIAGIAIEHGHDNRIIGNIIKRNRSGILLWTDYYEDLVRVFPDCEGSHSYTIARNIIESNRDGIRSYTEQRVRDLLCYGYNISDNTIRDNHTGIRLQRVRDCRIDNNRLVSNYGSGIWLINCQGIRSEENLFDSNRVDVIGKLDGKTNE